MKQEKVNKKEDQFKNEKAIFDKSVRAQVGDIYKVVSNGATIEWSNKLSEAQAAYRDAIKPKQMYKLPVEGGVICLGNVLY